MIDEALFKSDYLGKDGFIWWIGQVADSDTWKAQSVYSNFKDKDKADKNWPERCKVRIIGYHTFNRNELEDKDLPWAHIMMDPTIGSGQGGEGMTSNLTGGEVCFGFFLDGDDAQQPVVIGLLHRHRGVQNFPKDDGFAFRPFTGHSGNVPSTKREKIETTGTKESPSPIPPSVSRSNPRIAYTGGVYGFDQLSTIGFGTTVNLFNTTPININHGDNLWTLSEVLSQQAFLKKAQFTYAKPSGCRDNFIGGITQVLQDFIAFTNGIQKYANVYIDPILNEVVDITQSIKSVARSIGGIVRLIINSIRSGLMKCIISLFKKLIGLIIPLPQQSIVAQSTKNILDIIFCVFEKLIPEIISYIEELLTDLVDSAISAPICAAEQWTAGILATVMSTIEEGIEYITSGINWLTGGLSNVFDILNNASTLANKIYSFIGCDSLKCKKPSKWVSDFGPSEMEADNWQKMVENINFIRGRTKELDSIENAISELSLYGGGSSYDACNQLVNNPNNQDDLSFLPVGVKLNKCIPPVINVFGDGLGAKLNPIIDVNGSIIAIRIVSGGFGYTYSPILTVVDKSGYGEGAKAEAIIDSKGSISKILITGKGIGYCRTNDNLESGGSGNTNSSIFITSSKSRLYEGDSFELRITANNIPDNTELKYEISGIKKSNIKQDLEGSLTIKNRTATLKIDTIKDDVVEYKALKFRIPEYNKEIYVLIDDVSLTAQRSNFKLLSDSYNVSEGQSFTITLETKNVKDNTLIPFAISGITTSLLKNQLQTGVFNVVKNKSTLKIETNKGIIKTNQVFTLKLVEHSASVGVLVKLVKTPSISTKPKVCVQELVVVKPGIGYTLGDTITDGVNTYHPVISPLNGTIVSVKPLDNPICGFTDTPNLIINTTTGVGAEILPVLISEDDVSIDGVNTSTNRFGIGLGSTSVIDCI